MPVNRLMVIAHTTVRPASQAYVEPLATSTAVHEGQVVPTHWVHGDHMANISPYVTAMRACKSSCVMIIITKTISLLIWFQTDFDIVTKFFNTILIFYLFLLPHPRRPHIDRKWKMSNWTLYADVVWLSRLVRYRSGYVREDNFSRECSRFGKYIVIVHRDEWQIWAAGGMLRQKKTFALRAHTLSV